MNNEKIEYKSVNGKLQLERNDCKYDNGKIDLSWIVWVDNGYVQFEQAGRIDKLYDQDYFKLVLDEDTSYRSVLGQMSHMHNVYKTLEEITKDIELKLSEYKKEIIPNVYKTQMVQNCESIDELCKIFKMIEPVQGSQKEYSGDRLIEKIKILDSYVDPNDLGSGLAFSSIPWRNMTRTHGIRAKCMELLWYKKRGF